jgi:cytochrome P450
MISKPTWIRQAYLNEIVAARRRAPDKEDRSDLLTNLIRGGETSEKTGEEAKLSREELIG